MNFEKYGFSTLIKSSSIKEQSLNVLEVLDFECPYCKNVYTYLEKKLSSGKNNINLFVAHCPLPMHKNAELFAKIFEAGLILEKNFVNDLFFDQKIRESQPVEQIKYFAEKTEKPDMFIELINSKEIDLKIKNAELFIEEADITSIPVVMFKENIIIGYDEKELNTLFNEILN